MMCGALRAAGVMGCGFLPAGAPLCGVVVVGVVVTAVVVFELYLKMVVPSVSRIEIGGAAVSE